MEENSKTASVQLQVEPGPDDRKEPWTEIIQFLKSIDAKLSEICEITHDARWREIDESVKISRLGSFVLHTKGVLEDLDKTSAISLVR